MENIYEQHGYSNRKEYLESLADEYGVPLTVVYELADLLGDAELFDGLVNSLEDATEMDWN